MNRVDKNGILRDAARQFMQKAQSLPEVAEIVLCGSVAGNDPYPSDLDLAIILTTFDILEDLAKYARQMSSIAHNWEAFVFDDQLTYRGRICHRRECPGQSVDCLHPACGEVPHLKIDPDFEFDERLFFESPFEILLTPKESRFLKHKQELGIASRVYTPLKPLKRACIECGQRFTVDGGEQKWYEKRGLALPKRCFRCRIRHY
jgi:predicted nucleotidyltransferase